MVITHWAYGPLELPVYSILALSVLLKHFRFDRAFSFISHF
jgi:hypothetical protein